MTTNPNPLRGILLTKADGRRIVDEVQKQLDARIGEIEKIIDERNRQRATTSAAIRKLLELDEKLCAIEEARGGTVRIPVAKMAGLTMAEQLGELRRRGPNTASTDTGKVGLRGILQ